MTDRSRRPLYLSHDAHYDYLTALEAGRVDDGQAPEQWREVAEELPLSPGPAGWAGRRVPHR